MNIKTAAYLAGKNLLPGTISALLILSFPAFYFYSKLDQERKEVRAEKDQAITYLNSERDHLKEEMKTLAAERIAFESRRADIAKSEAERELEYAKRENTLQQREKQADNLIAAANKRADDLTKLHSLLQTEADKIAPSKQIYEANIKIESLLKEYSDLGVDLNAAERCNDMDDRRRRNIAKAKLDEAYAIAKRFGLDNIYDVYFNKNMQFFFRTRCQ